MNTHPADIARDPASELLAELDPAITVDRYRITPAGLAMLANLRTAQRRGTACLVAAGVVFGAAVVCLLGVL